MAVPYVESVASRSPGSASFSPGSGRATCSYFVPALQVQEAVKEILGWTEYDPSPDGRMVRHLPLAHPQFAFCYASAVTNVQGVGKPETLNVTAQYEAPVIVPMLALYKVYLLTVEFTQPPYSVVSDDNLPTYEQGWVNDDGDTVNDTFGREFLRFSDYEWDPDTEIVTAQHGQSVFRATGQPNGIPFPGMPRIAVPRALVRWRWFGVPLRYVESEDSYLARYPNYINQLPFYGWPVGSLLYRTYKIVRRYPQPVPDPNVIFGTTAFTPEKFVDLELYFEWTRRTLASPPTPMPVNGNWLPAGWNLQPWYRDRKFYYTTVSNTDPALQFPTHLSVPFQVLFLDPDSPP